MIDIAHNLTEQERKVLLALNEHGDEYFLYFRTIEGMTAITRVEIRKAARSLKSKGLAVFLRGLTSDDGYLAGSGYSITSEGKTVAASIEARNRLIDAAPELLEALKSALDRLEWLNDPRSGNTEKPWIKEASAAIAKAEGRS